MAFEIVDDVAAYRRQQSLPYLEFQVDSESGKTLFKDRAPLEEWDYEPEPEVSFDIAQITRKQGEVMNIRPSTFTEFAVRMPNKAEQKFDSFSFEGRRYLRQIYDTPSKRTLLKCGRQVEKSTLLGNKLLAYSCITQALNALYVSPTNQQTKVFSQDRLKEPIETSEYLKSWTTTKLSDNVFLKKFINRSQITLRYCYQSADRVRGIPADVICIDELQDILTDNIPIIEECASHSIFKIFMYSGTPKSLDNPIEWYWTEYSTQNEWVVPCHRHTISTPKGMSKVYWNILGEQNIGEESLICEKCEKPIHSMDDMSQWASMNPGVIRSIPKPYEGFRVPQIMVPWVSWDEIIQKQTTYSRPKFYNEVLGLSYDSGTRPLTRQDLIDNCDPGIHLNPDFLRKMKRIIGGSVPVFAGLDWGCHDEKTRILTPSGFKYFRDLTDEDRVAQWDPETREMSFVEPKVRTIRDWDQPLLHFKGKGLDMMLTHTHRMRVGTRQGTGPWVTESAERTAERGGNIKFVGHVDWGGEEKENFVLPGLPRSSGYAGSREQLFHMDGWLEFLGYYLSEGGLCFDKGRPSCLKMSQRETVNPEQADQMRRCLHANDIPFSEFPNPKTGDVNWTIYGKQYWKWMQENVGERGDEKRIPREFLGLSKRQLRILFDAMMLGDGHIDPRDGNRNGSYSSTSKGLCEDFQELCIRLGLRSTLRKHKEASKTKKAQWRVCWSTGRDFQFNTPSQRIEKVPYKGKVYCCSVPSGYIVTERNGCIAYQGNTGENTYTVLVLGAYLQERFTIFKLKRFEGRESEPEAMIDLISQEIDYWGVKIVGADYGGGFWPNDALIRKFGWRRIAKYQYSSPNAKVRWEDGLKRFLVNRTEVMSDMFNAIKRRDVFRFPCWEEFQYPFALDCLNIFSEYSEQRRENVYKKSPSVTDDSFHAILLCFLASMLVHPRPDVVAPMRDNKSAA